MKTIYLAHPFGGDPENKAKLEEIMFALSDKYPSVVFVSPIHALGHMYFKTDYITGMKQCLTLLDKCDEIWLCHGWEGSKGCCMEYAYAKASNKCVYAVDEEAQWVPILL